jgi:hypothetical protein
MDGPLRHAQMEDMMARQLARCRKLHRSAAGGYHYRRQLNTRGQASPCHQKDTITKDEQLSAGAFSALRARFQQQSRKAQAYYTVMHEVRGIVGSDDAASTWMNTPLPALGGKTPDQLVSDGRENDVLEHVRSLKTRTASQD